MCSKDPPQGHREHRVVDPKITLGSRFHMYVSALMHSFQ